MKIIPPTLYYTDTHEWIQIETENTVRVGITDHAQSLLGDIVFVELPTILTKANKGDPIAVLESVKAAADVYAPLSGEIIEVNDTLINQPDLINTDAYDQAWLFRLKLSDVNELTSLLSPGKYQEEIMAEAQ